MLSGLRRGFSAGLAMFAAAMVFTTPAPADEGSVIELMDAGGVAMALSSPTPTSWSARAMTCRSSFGER